MPNIYWTKNAIALIGPFGQSNFTNAREAAESSSSTVNTTSSNVIASGFIRSSGRGGSAFGFRRSYYGFDFTGYTAGTITNLVFNYTPTTTSTGTLSNRLAQFNGFGSALGSNYTDDDWWDSIADPLVPYSNAFNSADNSTAADVALNSTAINDAKADGFLKLVLMNSTDYNNFNLAVDVSNTTNWNIGSQSTGKVFLSFDYSAPSSFSDINSVSEVQLSEVNGVSSWDEINGV